MTMVTTITMTIMLVMYIKTSCNSNKRNYQQTQVIKTSDSIITISKSQANSTFAISIRHSGLRPSSLYPGMHFFISSRPDRATSKLKLRTIYLHNLYAVTWRTEVRPGCELRISNDWAARKISLGDHHFNEFWNENTAHIHTHARTHGVTACTLV